MDANLLLAFTALGLMAVGPIYFGAYAAMRLYVSSRNGKENSQVEHISADDAKRFPIVGSAALFSLYLLFRYIPKEYFQYALSGIVAFSGASVLSGLVHDVIVYLAPFLVAYIGEAYILELNQGKKLLFDLKFDQLHIATFVLAVAFAIYYEYTKDWIANNVLGLALAFSAIQLMLLDRFQTGFILLGGLFAYDIFWVFGTDVMVTVAKSFDAPIKVLFPRDLFAEQLKFTMLGLGDIVVPGLFIALALCFDESRSKGKAKYSKPYFTVCFIAYIIGLITTVVVMQIFQAAQPALLYLSPACTFSVLLTALIRGELKELLAFNTKPLPPAESSGSESENETSPSDTTEASEHPKQT